MDEDRTEAWLMTLRDGAALPAIPSAVARILELTASDNTQLAELTALVAADPTLAARVLRFVNSPLLGFSKRVSSVSHAVNLLGLRGLHTAVVGLSLAGGGRADAHADGFDLQQFWGRSLIAAVAAKALSKQTNKAAAEEAFVAGLLARIGHLAFAIGRPAEYGAVLREAEESARSLGEVERARLGTTHVALGARLCDHWGFPAHFVDALRGLSMDARQVPLPDDLGPLAHVVYVADLLAQLATDPLQRTAPRIEAAMQTAASHLDCREAQWIALAEGVAREWREALVILNVEPADSRWFAAMQSHVQHQVDTLARLIKAQSPTSLAEQRATLTRSGTDRATGFGNRAAFDQRLALEIERAKRTGAPLALLLVTLEDLRSHHETWGAAAVDQLLVAIARTVSATVRVVDFVARLNESELAIIALDCDAAGAAVLGARLHAQLPQATLDWRSETLFVGASVGAAWLRFPARAMDARALLDGADAERILARRANKRAREAVPPPNA